MTVHIVRLGSPRLKDEGLRIGTVRRPPRGVKKEDLAARDFYDVWFPELSPSPELMKVGQAAENDKQWGVFARKFRSEMNRPEKRRLLDLLAELSKQTNFSIGCYCADENRCHRSILRELFSERGVNVAQ